MEAAPGGPEASEDSAAAVFAERGKEEKSAVPAERSRDLEWLFGQARDGTREHAAGVLFASWGLAPSAAGGEEGECDALRSEGRGFLVITHYQRLLDHIKPDVVHIMADGRIVKTGGPELALEVENNGYADILAEVA